MTKKGAIRNYLSNFEDPIPVAEHFKCTHASTSYCITGHSFSYVIHNIKTAKGGLSIEILTDI